MRKGRMDGLQRIYRFFLPSFFAVDPIFRAARKQLDLKVTQLTRYMEIIH